MTSAASIWSYIFFETLHNIKSLLVQSLYLLHLILCNEFWSFSLINFDLKLIFCWILIKTLFRIHRYRISQNPFYRNELRCFNLSQSSLVIDNKFRRLFFSFGNIYCFYLLNSFSITLDYIICAFNLRRFWYTLKSFKLISFNIIFHLSYFPATKLFFKVFHLFFFFIGTSLHLNLKPLSYLKAFDSLKWLFSSPITLSLQNIGIL